MGQRGRLVYVCMYVCTYMFCIVGGGRGVFFVQRVLLLLVSQSVCYVYPGDFCMRWMDRKGMGWTRSPRWLIFVSHDIGSVGYPERNCGEGVGVFAEKKGDGRRKSGNEQFMCERDIAEESSRYHPDCCVLGEFRWRMNECRCHDLLSPLSMSIQTSHFGSSFKLMPCSNLLRL